MNSEPVSWPKQRVAKRKRGKNRKSKAAKLASQEPRLLHEDRRRSKAERALLRDTTARLRQIPASQTSEWVNLFRNKSSLPIGEQKRREDDLLRRKAVRDIMKIREKAGLEHADQTELWEGSSIDITSELFTKFSKEHLNLLEKRLRIRKSQRRFLEWALQLPNCATIPPDRVQWLRSLINDTARLTHESEMVPRMRAFYYIAACCNRSGIGIYGTILENGTDADAELHEWLLRQEPAFSEREDFTLHEGFHMDLDIEGLNWPAENNGSTVNYPIEFDDDDEMLGQFSDEEGDDIDEGEEPNDEEEEAYMGTDYEDDSDEEDEPEDQPQIHRSRPRAGASRDPAWDMPPEPVSDREL